MKAKLAAGRLNGCSHRTGTAKRKTEIALASPGDRGLIYRIRHEVYARELGQHRVNGAGRLTDVLDPFNLYLVARVGGELAGFISLTPRLINHSINKYVRRDRLPFLVTRALRGESADRDGPYRGRNWPRC
jgi:hypothetical protein